VHRDHYTQAVAIRREFGTRVELGLAERPTLEALQAPGSRPLASQIARLPEHGASELADVIARHLGRRNVDRDHWETPDAWITGGQIPLSGGPVLEAVETPGHTAGHVVFYDLAAGLLFAGDHVLPTITPSIGFEPAPTAAPLAAFLDSLAVVRARPDAQLLPAHGPVTGSVHARVDELVRHHEQRLEEMAAVAADRGAVTAAEVARSVPWTRRRRSLDELDPFNAMLAIFETVAHLDLLAAQGRLQVAVTDGLRRYR
jgi:glyoxylase-like metal-dependent hydrolase (beta-lactamase superfamily II)